MGDYLVCYRFVPSETYKYKPQPTIWNEWGEYDTAPDAELARAECEYSLNTEERARGWPNRIEAACFSLAPVERTQEVLWDRYTEAMVALRAIKPFLAEDFPEGIGGRSVATPEYREAYAAVLQALGELDTLPAPDGAEAQPDPDSTIPTTQLEFTDG